jgi:hypothetical protein
MYLACIRRARLSGIASFAIVTDSDPSSFRLQNIDHMAQDSPGNKYM